MSDLLRGVAVLSILLPLFSCAPRSSSPPSRQDHFNVVVVLSDSLRASNLSFHGYDRETAPVLSELLASSIVFEDHLANYPGTPVSVSQLMTGRLMPPLLMDQAFAFPAVREIEEDLLILPRVLQQAGYRTAIVSSHPWFNRRARLLRFFDDQRVVAPRRGEAYARFEDLLPPAVKILEDASEPFFLYLHSMDTHSPFQPPAKYGDLWPRDGRPGIYDHYDGEIAYTDAGVGALVDELRERGLLDRTLFVFTSDHGEEFGEQGRGRWNWSHGYTVRRPQLHVPLIVRMPGGRGGGGRISKRTDHLDLAPTLLSLARANVQAEGLRVDGRDLSDLLETGSMENRDRPAEEARTVAYSWRYWGLHHEDVVLEWDQWQDQTAMTRTARGPFNYQDAVPFTDGALESALKAELLDARERGRADFERLAAAREMAVAIPIGVPTTLVDGGGRPPTFARVADDDRWFLDNYRLLEASPVETPPPLTVSTPWTPGSYRVQVRLAPGSRAAGFRQSFVLRIGDSAPLRLDAAELAADEALLDAGVHEIGRHLVLEFSEPRGGVAISGLLVEPQGVAAGEGEQVDPRLEEQLRALGYVE